MRGKQAVQIDIQTARAVTPKIYAYTTPEIARHDGWIKIGYTERNVLERINEQVRTVDVQFKLEWTEPAIYCDTRETFTDRDFHAYLNRQGVKNNLEWFNITAAASKEKFYEFRRGRELKRENLNVTPYILRDEQELAIQMTLDYWRNNGGQFLWNAKPRFGKTLAVYDLCKRADARKILIVTNRPAIANSWYDDYVKFVGGDYFFVSEVDALKGKPHILSRAEFSDAVLKRDNARCIEFVSLQDLKGSLYFGGDHDKLREVAEITWDILVVDEAHEGIDTLKTDVAFDRIKRGFTLHLSGTPFKALATQKFPADAIFNWTYADEQSKKNSWQGIDENPYANLPQLNLYTYQMSEIVRDELQRGIEINGETEEYAFDLNEFFSTQDGKFVYDSSVDKFLDALTTQKKFTFSTAELRDELRHTFWLLDRVDSARALADKLQRHPIFRDYKIILAAGDGRLDDETIKKSFDKVTEAIAAYERTITLSVGQLTTGVTIPQWTGVLILANVNSPALYMQAAFRAQNPCLFRRGENFLRKENAYVFDFDPARTLKIFEAFANDLADGTGGGRGDSERRLENIRELLNFFPVIGEDDNGELIELDAAKILEIPRKIRSVEVVRRGFMSDFLFTNIAHVFHAPPEVIEIISRIPTAKDITIDLRDEVSETTTELFLDDDGEISLPEEYVIGRAAELFGEKIYGANSSIDDIVKQTLDTAQKIYGGDFKSTERNTLERQLSETGKNLVERLTRNHEIEQKILEHEYETALSSGESFAEVDAKFEVRRREVEEIFQAELTATITDFAKSASETVVEVVETRQQEAQKNSVADDVREHLRGFARTIPSFLMAYGVDKTVTLATFDQIIPSAVFEELTSITLEQFRYLRDEAKLFDEVTFDDSVAEFLRLRIKLADYFAEGQEEDIFDYIPPQRTNQIFTPKETAKFMADMLLAESPNCFDAPEKKFVDPYMKSGLFVAEIVKRLYRSPRHKELFPEKAERLRHIFTRQIYGLAPTEIIYRIAVNYLLGFGVTIERHNLRLANAFPAAEGERLEKFLDELFCEEA